MAWRHASGGACAMVEKRTAALWEWGFRWELLRHTVWPWIAPFLPPFGAVGGMVLKMLEHAQWSDVFLYWLWGLSAGFAVLFFVTRLLKELPNAPEQSTREDVGVSVAAPNTEIEAFYRTYDNVLLRDVEDHLRTQLAPFTAAADREGFLLRSYATFVTVGIFEYVWVLIYGSQLRALHYLNRGHADAEDLRSFYDAAVHR